MASASRYRTMLRRHLQEHRPRQYARMKAEGGLNRHLTETAGQIAESVEQTRQQILERNPPPMGTVERTQHLNWAQKTAEEMVLAEYLPMDEQTQSKIGPSGGYED
jgi:hypothetical protein